MATLNGVSFINDPWFCSDGSINDGNYRLELAQQLHLPPSGEYWIRRWRSQYEALSGRLCVNEHVHDEWEPARVNNDQYVLLEGGKRPAKGCRGLGSFSLIGLHCGETQCWDLAQAEWWVRTVPAELPR